MAKKSRLSILSYSPEYRFKLIYFLISVLPLIGLAYVVVNYVYPALSPKEREMVYIGIPAAVVLLTFLSVLGYIILLKDVRTNISRLSDYATRVSALLSVSQSLSLAYHLDVVLERIVRAATAIVGAEAGTIFFIDPDNEKLFFKVATGEVGKKIQGLALRFGQGIAGWVASHGEPLIVNDVAGDKRFDPSFDILTGFTTRSVLAVPLLFQGRVTGVIEILNKEEGEFASEDMEILESLAGQAAISIKNAELYEAQHNYFTHGTELIVAASEQVVSWQNHLRNVAKYANLITRKLNLGDEERRNIYFAALLHDIGMIRIPPVVSPADREKVKEHPVIGEKMVSPIIVFKKAAPLIRHHHERYDGSGYPDGLKGVQIPRGSRVIHVAEVFDAIANKDSYSYKGLDVAKRELKVNAGSQFDPHMVSAFLSIIEAQPDVVVK
jgi:putative methionine-R-sulfoxide reductase with GAF domain